jgi:hypothetical protein
MIMPSKHINFSQSFLGFGSYILSKLDRPICIDEIWKIYQDDLLVQSFNAKHSFDNLIMTLIFLYGINAIDQKNGLIYKCN